VLGMRISIGTQDAMKQSVTKSHRRLQRTSNVRDHLFRYDVTVCGRVKGTIF
jgi:hypothetical protein